MSVKHIQWSARIPKTTETTIGTKSTLKEIISMLSAYTYKMLNNQANKTTNQSNKYNEDIIIQLNTQTIKATEKENIP